MSSPQDGGVFTMSMWGEAGHGFGCRVFRGVVSSGLGQLIVAVEPVLLVPLFLRVWGAETYGRYLAVAAQASYLAVLDFGAQAYVGNLLAMERARAGTEGFRRVLSEAVSLFLVVVCIAALVITPFVLRHIPFSGDTEWAFSEWRWVFAALGGLALLAVPSGIYVTSYRASGLFARAAMLGNVARAIGLAVGAVILAVAASPAWYAGAAFVAGVSVTTLLWWDSRRQIPACRGVTIGFGEAYRGLRFLKGSLHFWLLSIAQAVKLQAPLLIIATAGPASFVGLYATHRALANLAGSVTGLLQGPLFPELTVLSTGARIDELRKVVKLVIRINTACAAAAALIVWIATPIAYSAWTRRELTLDPALLTLLLAQGLLAAGWSTSTWCLQATNQHQSLVGFSLANAGATVFGGALLVGDFGVVGVALATLAADVVFGLLPLPPMAAAALGMRSKELYGDMVAALLVVVPLAVAAHGAVIFLGPAYAAIAVASLAVVLWYPLGYLLLGRATMERLAGSFRTATGAARQRTPGAIKP